MNKGPHQTCLVVVDMQVDFCNGGALEVPGTDTLIPELNKYVQCCLEKHYLIAFSRDWHPFNHTSFEQNGGHWPVHCVANTRGADYSPELIMPSTFFEIRKGAHRDQPGYSVFENTGLAEALRRIGVRTCIFCGVATEYCVTASAEDALKMGFEVVLKQTLVRAIDDNDGADAICLLAQNGVCLQ